MDSSSSERIDATALRNRALRFVDYVNAHATSTPLGDQIESEVVQRVFGGAAESEAEVQPACYLGSTKGSTGHLQVLPSII